MPPTVPLRFGPSDQTSLSQTPDWRRSHLVHKSCQIVIKFPFPFQPSTILCEGMFWTDSQGDHSQNNCLKGVTWTSKIDSWQDSWMTEGWEGKLEWSGVCWGWVCLVYISGKRQSVQLLSPKMLRYMMFSSQMVLRIKVYAIFFYVCCLFLWFFAWIFLPFFVLTGSKSKGRMQDKRVWDLNTGLTE